jgi:exonuclease III
MKSKISSLITNGIIGNIIFEEYLINNSDITFLQEHWLYNNNKYIIENLCKKMKKFFSFLLWAIIRPWGGLCWIIKKEIKVINHEILDEGISVIDVKINENPLCIIGVYLKYNSSNTESNLKFQHQLRILEECICNAKEMNTEFIIIGDFNGDIQRLRYLNDINLLNFINKTGLESV